MRDEQDRQTLNADRRFSDKPGSCIAMNTCRLEQEESARQSSAQINSWFLTDLVGVFCGNFDIAPTAHDLLPPV